MIILILSVLEILISVTVQSVYNSADNERPLSGTARVIALICTAITCRHYNNTRYDMESIPESRTESSRSPDSLSKITLKRKPSVVTPHSRKPSIVSLDSSMKKPNGEIKRARTEYAWKRDTTCDRTVRILTAKDLSESLNTLCFVIFLLFWLISTIVIMIILSSSAS